MRSLTLVVIAAFFLLQSDLFRLHPLYLRVHHGTADGCPSRRRNLGIHGADRSVLPQYQDGGLGRTYACDANATVTAMAVRRAGPLRQGKAVRDPVRRARHRLLPRWSALRPLHPLPRGLGLLRQLHHRLHGLLPTDRASFLALREAVAGLWFRVPAPNTRLLSSPGRSRHGPLDGPPLQVRGPGDLYLRGDLNPNWRPRYAHVDGLADDRALRAQHPHRVGIWSAQAAIGCGRCR